MRKRLRPLALQATAAERAAKLAEEVTACRRRSRRSTSRRSASAAPRPKQRRGTALAARQELEAKLEALLAARAAAEEELTDAAGEREGATAALYRLRSRRRAARASPRGGREPRSRSCEAWAAAPPPTAAARTTTSSIQLTRERLAALEHALAEREGLAAGGARARRAGRAARPEHARRARREGARGRRGARPSWRRAACRRSCGGARSSSSARARPGSARWSSSSAATRASSSCRSSRSSSCSHRRPPPSPRRESAGIPRRGELWFAGRDGRGAAARARGAPPQARRPSWPSSSAAPRRCRRRAPRDASTPTARGRARA